MGKSDFGSIKSLVHFDFPYFNEPNDGLDDDVGLETWSAENGNVKLIGTQIPAININNQTPKFGYRCAFFGSGAVVGTNNTGIWNLNSSKDYEIEFFVFPTAPSSHAKYLLRLCSSGDTAILIVALDASGYITVLCPEWGISSAVTSSIAPEKSGWRHVLLRISNNTLKLYIEGTEAISQTLISDVILSVANARIGYNAGNARYYFCIDEFVFRHSADTDAPTVPSHTYSGRLDISKVGGYGTGEDGDVTIGSKSHINSYGMISSITDAKTFTVSAWSNGTITPAAGREVMIHITAPRSTVSAAYPLVGLYTFAKIESLDSTNVVLNKEITTGSGYDFTLDSSLLNTYYVQAIIVPNYNSLTINSGITVSPLSWNTTTGGGIVAFRCKVDCTVNGSIITHSKGAVRYDLQQITNSKLIDRFLCSQGGGVFISCGGTLTIPSTARLGASWSGSSGAGQPVSKSKGGNGGAGYGGAGGSDEDNAATGGKGGVGGGGGGGNSAAGGDAGGSRTGGYGINDITSFIGGAQGVTAGGNSLTVEGVSGGGGAGGNSGNSLYKGSVYTSGAVAGASIILIAKAFNANVAALSIGGEGGNSNYGATGGAGTGFCYIACGEQV